MKQFDDLIGWCRSSHPNDHPRLRRVVGCNLERFDTSPDGSNFQSAQWSGNLLLSKGPRYDLLIGSLKSSVGVSNFLVMSVADASSDAWLGLEGLGAGPEWAEDTHFDPETTTWSPETRVLTAALYHPGTPYHFDLQMWPTYLYGG